MIPIKMSWICQGCGGFNPIGSDGCGTCGHGRAGLGRKEAGILLGGTSGNVSAINAETVNNVYNFPAPVETPRQAPPSGFGWVLRLLLGMLTCSCLLISFVVCASICTVVFVGVHRAFVH